MFAKTVGSRIAGIFDGFHIAFKIIRIALQILRLYGFASVRELLRNARFGFLQSLTKTVREAEALESFW